MTAPQRGTATGTVYDLGYTPHEGERLGRSGAVTAVVREGIRRVLGIRRKARRKVLPWSLVAIAVVPAVVFVGLAFFLEGFDPTDADIFSHAQYFNVSATMALLFTALSAPELLVPDRAEGVLSVYASRPLRARDYLGARATSLGLVVFGFLLLPQILLYVGLAAVRDDGFLTEIVRNAEDLFQILVASIVYFVAYGTPALIVATYANRVAAAAGIYLAVMFVANGVAEGLTQATGLPGHRFGALLALPDLPDHVRNWIFDFSSATIPGDAGFDPWASLLVIVGVAVAAVGISARRYRQEL